MADSHIAALTAPNVRAWLEAHAGDDVRALAFAPFPFDPALRPLLLDQIKARQKARDKLPRWAADPALILPPSDLLEQASSAPSAAYKARIVSGGARAADLTAGAGADAAALAARYDAFTCVEADAQAAALLRHNLPLLAGKDIEVVNARAEDYAASMPPADLVFIDPQRREAQGRRGIFRLEDAAPDVTALLPRLRARHILIKTSPMLDIAQAAATLPGLAEVHILEWKRQCREVLYLLAPGTQTPFAQAAQHCVTLNDDGSAAHDFTFTQEEERAAQAPLSMPLAYILEPGAALMKGGAFNLIATRLGLAKLHPATHLYTAAQLPESFPGRAFRLDAILPPARKAVQAALGGTRAHLKSRNFPGEALALQKKLGLAEGGDAQLFACTLADGSAVLLQTSRIA
jgi:hypothetical protein